MKTRFSLFAIAALVLCSCDDRLANTTPERGTNDETSTFYLADGQKAANASVFIYPLRSTDSLPVATAYTDANGKVAIEKLDRGLYSLVVRSPSGEAVFVDSVFSNGTTASVRSDTLRRTGTLKGKVKVQPQDDPKIAWLYLQGAGIYANVDDSGSFQLTGVPEGRYTLLARTDRTNYTTTVRSVVVHPDSLVDAGTIELVYTGLPVVTGIVGVWDSMGGAVTVHWDPSPSPKVKGYEIWRGASNDPQVERRLGYVDSAVASWKDTVFPNNDNAFESTKAYVRYRVAPVAQDGTPGVLWNSWSDSLRPPFLVAKLAAKWNLVSSTAPTSPARLDTLNGGLVLIEQVEGGMALSVSPDGASWRRIRIDPGFVGYSTMEPGSLEGVAYQGRFWWVRKGSGTRSVPVGYANGLTQDLFDSLRILSIDASGSIDSFALLASGDSVSRCRLALDSSGLVLFEGVNLASPATSQALFQPWYRHLLGVDHSVRTGDWPSWYPSWPDSAPGTFWPSIGKRMVSPSGKVVWDPMMTRTLLFTLLHNGEPYQLFLDSLLIGGNGTWYARPGSINDPHRVETPSGIAPSAITWWRGRIWVADSSRVWNLTIPDRLPKAD